MACLHGVDDGSMDEALFEFFKKQVCILYFCLHFFNSLFWFFLQKIKELKSKL